MVRCDECDDELHVGQWSQQIHPGREVAEANERVTFTLGFLQFILIVVIAAIIGNFADGLLNKRALLTLAFAVGSSVPWLLKNRLLRPELYKERWRFESVKRELMIEAEVDCLTRSRWMGTGSVQMRTEFSVSPRWSMFALSNECAEVASQWLRRRALVASVPREGIVLRGAVSLTLALLRLKGAGLIVLTPARYRCWQLGDATIHEAVKMCGFAMARTTHEVPQGLSKLESQILEVLPKEPESSAISMDVAVFLHRAEPHDGLSHIGVARLIARMGEKTGSKYNFNIESCFDERSLEPSAQDSAMAAHRGAEFIAVLREDEAESVELFECCVKAMRLFARDAKSQ